MHQVARRLALLALLLGFPARALAHGDQIVFEFAYLPLIVAAGAYLVSLPSSAWDRKAKVVAAIVVIGTSAVLTITDLVCFGFLRPLGCFYPLTSIDKWPFVTFALQFTLPYLLWAVVGRWARRSGRAGPKSVGRIGGW